MTKESLESDLILEIPSSENLDLVRIALGKCRERGINNVLGIHVDFENDAVYAIQKPSNENESREVYVMSIGEYLRS